MDIVVPQLGESVSEATVARWHKKVGDVVKADEPIVELETDKVTLEINSPGNGKLSGIAYDVGDEVGVGIVLGAIEEGEVTESVIDAEVSDEGLVSGAPAASADSGLPQNQPSPAVRKLIADNNLDLGSIVGTGKGGRLTKADVVSYMENLDTDASSQVDAQAEPIEQKRKSTNRNEERVRLSRLRKRIAERLKEAQNTAAILTTFNEVDMTAVLDARSRYKEQFEKKHGVRLGFMSFFAKACIIALGEIPAVNAMIDGDEIVYRQYVDMGIAVGTDQGLVVPVIRDAQERSFSDIEKSVGELGKKARSGELSVEDLTGGSFTITNGGVYGSLLSTPIINPPQSAILGMHKIQERPIAINGEALVRPMMYLALSYDHRIIDGAEAVTFLVRVKECIEEPDRILFDV
ncbi:MAG: 2-oxoglutarate dehydrogenase complex dihydrolipoyllysine-residue succinyltransferase [Pseudomonadota bacterium]|nr:2-oxoglutarate dehydrogenase complex dihydrolipoyllysine-residue succinyltransferase [Pseudomonadota bacterium]